MLLPCVARFQFSKWYINNGVPLSAILHLQYHCCILGYSNVRSSVLILGGTVLHVLNVSWLQCSSFQINGSPTACHRGLLKHTGHLKHTGGGSQGPELMNTEVHHMSIFLHAVWSCLLAAYFTSCILYFILGKALCTSIIKYSF